jgi:hypothetical protein
MSDKPDTKDTHLPPAKVTKAFQSKVKKYAQAVDRSQSWLIVKALEEYMKNHPAKGDS